MVEAQIIAVIHSHRDPFERPFPGRIEKIDRNVTGRFESSQGASEKGSQGKGPDGGEEQIGMGRQEGMKGLKGFF